MLRFYHVDLLDFYRCKVSARRVNLLIDDLLRQHNSSLVRAINGGYAGWSPVEHLLADHWYLTLTARNPKTPIKDHPAREAMQRRVKQAQSRARDDELKATFEERKWLYSKRYGGA